MRLLSQVPPTLEAPWSFLVPWAPLHGPKAPFSLPYSHVHFSQVNSVSVQFSSVQLLSHVRLSATA